MTIESYELPRRLSSSENVSPPVHSAVLQKVEDIIDNLAQELIERKTIISRYQTVHCLLKKFQIIFHSVSLAMGSSAAASFATGIGVPIAIGFATTTTVTSALGIMCQLFDQRVMRKLHKHMQLQTLARTFDITLFDKYMKDSVLSVDNWKEIISLLQKYYTDRDMLEAKSIFTGTNINQLIKEYTEISKNNRQSLINS